jgi:tannase/feruloyl esterase
MTDPIRGQRRRARPLAWLSRLALALMALLAVVVPATARTATVNSAVLNTTGSYAPPPPWPPTPITGLPSFCAVNLPQADSAGNPIHIAVWLPASWNGRFHATVMNKIWQGPATTDGRPLWHGLVGGAEKTDSFARLFFAPGAAHCASAVGPAPADPLAALATWVEHGQAPQSIPATLTDPATGAVTLSRPVCAFPLAARYTGHGSTSQAGNFTCTPAYQAGAPELSKPEQGNLR